MPAGGELAALFARRAQVADGDEPADAAPKDEPMTAEAEPQTEPSTSTERLASAAPATAATATGSLPPLASPPQVSAPDTPSSRPPIPPAEATPTPTDIEPDVKAAANPLQDDEKKAEFDNRNLEAGIPTASFLANVRKNLKKPGEKPASDAGVGADFSSDSDVAKRALATFGKGNSFRGDPAGSGKKSGPGHARSSSFSMVQGGNNSAKPGMARNDSLSKGGLRSASTCSSDDNVNKSSAYAGGKIPSSASACSASSAPLVEKAAASASAIVSNMGKKNRTHRSNSESGSLNSVGNKSDAMAARRSRMVASRAVTSSSSVMSESSSKPNSAEKTVKPKKTSPAYLRREKLLARVRASQGSNAGKMGVKDNQSNTGSNISLSKTSIISPKRDEFEVLFADDSFNFSPNESIDSISNEMHRTLNNSTSTAGSQTTLPTSNHGLQPKVAIKSATMTTPEKARLQNASTPKIRGNSNYRRDRYDNANSEEGPGVIKLETVHSNISGVGKSDLSQSTPKRVSKHNNMPSFQEQQQQMEALERDDFVPDELATPRRQQDIPQSYPLRQSPSQMSQMSGITTPSCFPQEFHVPLGPTPGHLQQPMLPAYETASMGSSPAGNAGGEQQVIGTSSGAFSSGVESENRRLREQLSSMKKKLEEKDAIISQLMKRIGDLETMQTTFNMAATPSSVSTSLHSAGARSPVDAFAMSSHWDQSQPHQQEAFQPTAGNAFSQPQRSSSFDAEGARFSVPSSPMTASSPRHQQRKQRSLSGSGKNIKNIKVSPNTTTTSSTASVTTANSSKSGRKQLRRSVSDTRRARQSPRSQASSAQEKDIDPRKFVC